MGQHFDRLHRLHRANHSDQRRHDACFDAGERILPEQTAQTAVTRLAFLIGKDRNLAFHANRRPGDQRFLMLEAAAIKLVADSYVVGAVEH